MTTSSFARHLSRWIPLFIVLAFSVGAFCHNQAGWPGLETAATQGAAETETVAEAPGADDWFYAQRAYPLPDIPPGARAQAFEQMKREEARLKQAGLAALVKQAEAAAETAPVWQPLGPAPIANGNLDGGLALPASGRVMSLALDPNYDGTGNRTIYLGAAHGGLWRSLDNGATWMPLLDEEASQAVGAITIDPNNPNVIYVGTGTGSRSISSYYGAGLLKSVDGGATWRLIPGPLSTRAPFRPAFQMASMPRLALDPNNSSTLYACTVNGSITSATGSSGSVPLGQRGVWKSNDGGETWRNLDPSGNGGATNASDLVIDPRNSNFVMAALQSTGLYRSLAGGETGTWERLSGGLPAAGTFGRVALTTGPPLPPSTNPTFFAAFATSSSTLQLFRSVDNGDTWQALSVPAGATQTFHNLVLMVDPVDANVLYAGEVRLHRSLNGGASWERVSNGDGSGGLHVDQHAFVINPRNRNQIFVGNDGGVWRSDNATAALIRWQNLNLGLNIAQFQGLALHPSDPNFLLGGTQDNGSLRFTNNPAWTTVAGGDGGAAVIDQSNPTTVYHNFQSGTGSYGPRVSFNSGSNWTDIGCRNCAAVPGRLNPTDRVSFYSPMAQHAGFTQAPSGNVIYFGTHRLYRSANNGGTWTGLGPSADGFGQDLTRGSGTVTAIAAPPRLDTSTLPPGEIVWVGASDGTVQVSVNAGKLADATFTNVTQAPLPNRFVTDIAPDPANPQRAYVAFSGFDASTPATPGHIFLTEDGGASWRNFSGNLPDVPVLSLALDPLLPGTVYAGTDLGVFRTVDGGETWLRFGTGIPNTSVFILRYHAASRSLVAATHGRGVFRLALGNPALSVSAANYRRESLAVEAIAALFGEGLATRTEAATALPLPTQLAGTTVRLTDTNGVEHLAPLFFVSPQQINYQIPPGVAAGTVTVTIFKDGTLAASGVESARAVAPSLFTANANGRGVPAGYGVRVRNGVQSLVTIARTEGGMQVPEPIDLGPADDQVVLVIFGTGLRRRPALSSLTLTIGGLSVPAEYAGETPGLVGLDQLNFLLPRALAGRGEVVVTLSAGGSAANAVTVNIK
jgi:uncharacterized protein (TIGR03437 family)